MVDVLLAALLTVGAPGECQAPGLTTWTCDTSGTITDDGARLDGSLWGDGDDNAIDVDGGGDEAQVDPGFYCGRRTSLRCHLPDPPPVGVLTLADIASFTADGGTLRTEPNGWAAIGLPFNAISTAATHEVEGVLLGAPATVRFTPVAWRWDFGDGSEPTATVTGGASWADLSVPEFEPTPTSHVYATRGRYAVAAVVTFVADYRIGAGPWASIPGTLDLMVRAPAAILAVSARTVLVAENCTENARGPGC